MKYYTIEGVISFGIYATCEEAERLNVYGGEVVEHEI